MPRKSKRKTRRRTRRKRGGVDVCSVTHAVDKNKADKFDTLSDAKLQEFKKAMGNVTFVGNTWKPNKNPELLNATKLLDNILREAHKCKCRDYVRCYINDNIWREKMGYNLTTKLIKAMINEDNGRVINFDTVNNIFMNVENIHIKDHRDQWRYLPFIEGEKIELLPLTNEDQKHSQYRLTDSQSIQGEKERNFKEWTRLHGELKEEATPKVGGRWPARSSGPTNKKGSRKKTKKKRTKNKTKKKRRKKRRRKRRR